MEGRPRHPDFLHGREEDGRRMMDQVEEACASDLNLIAPAWA